MPARAEEPESYIISLICGAKFWLLDIYTKNEKEDLNEPDKKKLFKIIKETIQ